MLLAAKLHHDERSRRNERFLRLLQRHVTTCMIYNYKNNIKKSEILNWFAQRLLKQVDSTTRQQSTIVEEEEFQENKYTRENISGLLDKIQHLTKEILTANDPKILDQLQQQVLEIQQYISKFNIQNISYTKSHLFSQQKYNNKFYTQDEILQRRKMIQNDIVEEEISKAIQLWNNTHSGGTMPISLDKRESETGDVEFLICDKYVNDGSGKIVYETNRERLKKRIEELEKKRKLENVEKFEITNAKTTDMKFASQKKYFHSMYMI